MAEDKGLTQSPSRSSREEKVLQFWKDNDIFAKTLEKQSPKGEFVFYEGPPTANGRPGIHHIEARAFKDAIPRYRTMRGFHVRRKAGWDTHGLPVELEVEKQLGFKSKKEIEEYGIEKFNEECKKSVWKYVDEWQKFSDRIGYWVDIKDAYVTYRNNFIQSVWSIVSKVEDRGLLYKDYKVVPWCPRDGTALSSHELAQGYQDVKDLSLYVKFKIVGFPDAYFLAWTTTPWTLPGNLALAVGPDITYVEAKVGGEILVLAKDRLSIIKDPYEIVAEHKGSEMVGMQYEPFYNFVEATNKTFKVYEADFVTTTDGTGIVHTAVMYGQDDFELGTKVGLPKKHLVSTDGTFVKGTGWLEGRSVVDETLAVDILKDLKERGFLFDKENYAHSYPFCWRCKTRLIYYARDSWYIRMSELRDKLVKENGKINWEPEYIKEGRFGEWLREVKDWAISRERYWGTPLPIWINDDGEQLVVDSVETLKKYAKTNGNKYFVMRHGEAENNVKNLLNATNNPSSHLTEEGKRAVKTTAKSLKKASIDMIFASPITRAEETARLVSEEIGLSSSQLTIDDRIREMNQGVFDNKSRDDWRAQFSSTLERFERASENGETLRDVRKRMGDFIYDIDSKHSGKNILIVSHGDPIWMLQSLSAGLNEVVSVNKADELYPEKGQAYKMDFVPLPHNKDLELDLHKPFIDDVVLVKDGKEYKRVKEVMDVWFDSGSVPFAQDSEEREKPGDFKKILYPADFISEGLDQTRGWFYTMHAIGTLMEKGIAFKNVICLGLILDKEGKKMSKSVGNVVNPWEMIEKYGVDALRLWMYSVNQPGEPKNFDERTVDEINKRVFNMVDNVYAFYSLYRDKSLEENDINLKNPSVLDRWIPVRLSQLVDDMTDNLDEYRLLEPVRAMREFIDDLSTWYLRRSRDRIKDGEKEAKQTLYFVLKTLSKLLAPFAPFAAEELYINLRTEKDAISVHMTAWPEAKWSDKDIIERMSETRRLVSLALEARSKANIKIRQPLAKLELKDSKLPAEYLQLIKDEVNVKSVTSNKNLTEEISLDSNLTPELIEEGQVRDEIRSIQEMRKERGLKPGEIMNITVPSEKAELYAKHAEAIKRATSIEF